MCSMPSSSLGIGSFSFGRRRSKSSEAPERELEEDRLERLREHYGDEHTPRRNTLTVTTQGSLSKQFVAPSPRYASNLGAVPTGGDVPPLMLKGEWVTSELPPANGDGDVFEKAVTDRFSLDRKLGQGGYAVVWKATDQASGQCVVLKKILDAFVNEADTRAFAAPTPRPRRRPACAGLPALHLGTFPSRALCPPRHRLQSVCTARSCTSVAPTTRPCSLCSLSGVWGTTVTSSWCCRSWTRTCTSRCGQGWWSSRPKRRSSCTS